MYFKEMSIKVNVYYCRCKLGSLLIQTSMQTFVCILLVMNIACAVAYNYMYKFNSLV